jgi:hypothetical protein
VLALAGCGSSSGSSTHSAASSPSGSAASGGSGAVCHPVPVPAPKEPGHLRPPTLTLNPSRTYTVTAVTNCGTFAFTLDVKQSPKTSASVYSLVKRGFYNGLTPDYALVGKVVSGQAVVNAIGSLPTSPSR